MPKNNNTTSFRELAAEVQAEFNDAIESGIKIMTAYKTQISHNNKSEIIKKYGYDEINDELFEQIEEIDGYNRQIKYHSRVFQKIFNEKVTSLEKDIEDFALEVANTPPLKKKKLSS